MDAGVRLTSAEKYEAELAKERQLATLKKGAAPVPARLPERSAGEAREKAAAAVGVSPRHHTLPAPCSSLIYQVDSMLAGHECGRPAFL